jgi:tRNA threonylcarbamoyladenosine biosynthesis protein TsaB
MIVLGVDTSGNKGIVGIAQGTEIIEFSLDMTRKHLRLLLPAIENALKESGFDLCDIELLAVVLGPGSWSGLRIGVTTMKTMAHFLGKPIVGLCTLDVLAYHFRFTNIPVYPLIDGARRQVYYAGYQCQGKTPERFTDYRLMKVEDFSRELEGPSILLGEGALKYHEELNSNSQWEISVPPPFYSQTRAAFIIEAAIQKYEKAGSDTPLSLAPLYMQEASAERALRE